MWILEPLKNQSESLKSTGKVLEICFWKRVRTLIHSTQYYLKYIDRVILANLQCRTLKLGRLIVLQETPAAIKVLLPWQLTLFQSLSDFQLQKRLMEPQTQLDIFICLLDHAYEAPFANMKMECWGWPEMAIILGRSGTQCVAMVAILLQRINHFWYKLAQISFSSYLIKI